VSFERGGRKGQRGNRRGEGRAQERREEERREEEEERGGGGDSVVWCSNMTSRSFSPNPQTLNPKTLKPRPFNREGLTIVFKHDLKELLPVALWIHRRLCEQNPPL